MMRPRKKSWPEVVSFAEHITVFLLQLDMYACRYVSFVRNDVWIRLDGYHDFFNISFIFGLSYCGSYESSGVSRYFGATK